MHWIPTLDDQAQIPYELVFFISLRFKAPAIFLPNNNKGDTFPYNGATKSSALKEATECKLAILWLKIRLQNSGCNYQKYALTQGTGFTRSVHINRSLRLVNEEMI